jgi:phenylacetate-CoA ligase
MKDFQLKKFKALIQHCYENVPFYKKYMDEHRILVSDIISLEQITLFPIITKEIIKEYYDEFTPRNYKKIKGIKCSQTGGTTGNILFKRNDSNTRSSIWGAYKRFNDWMGIRESKKKLILMGGHVMGSTFPQKFKKKINDFLLHQISFSPYDTSEDNINNIIHALCTNDFVLIRSYSQFLYQLALKLKEKNLKFNIKSITTTAEPLTLGQRKLFKEVFNADVFDQFGCGEIGGIAFECDHHQGLHVCEERVILESNDNYSMPFIRYWNADQVKFSDTKCSCGRNSRLIKEIMGRTCDYILGLNGEILHWAYFWHLFFDSNLATKRNLKKFQVIQNTLDTLSVRLVCEPLDNIEKETLTQNIQSRLGEIQIEYLIEKDIENSKSGKYRAVINNTL